MDPEFKQLLTYFPQLEFPLVLQEGSEHHFGMNDAVPDELLARFIIPALDFEINEFTEFIPCGHWMQQGQIPCLVIWCARLMRYSFYLISYTPQGTVCDTMEIAGFFSDNEYLFRRMANIDEEGTIFIVEGGHLLEQKEFDQSKNRKLIVEILQDGKLLKMPAL
ncbi:MAG: hypothetical protein IPJ64_02920 [Saprospiraceae bacterium]|nr:hypothetical protein [Saprospiraceae bacterium]MBK7795307.1 hypothetical protein [Saprospiraceae bacterium]